MSSNFRLFNTYALWDIVQPNNSHNTVFYMVLKIGYLTFFGATWNNFKVVLQSFSVAKDFHYST